MFAINELCMTCPFAPGRYWHWLSTTSSSRVACCRVKFLTSSENPAQTDEQCCVAVHSKVLKYGWQHSTCLTWKWPGFDCALLNCLPPELLSEGGRAEAREQPGHQPHHALHMVRLRGKNACTSWWSLYAKCRLESLKSSLRTRSAWLCDVIYVVSVTFPSFMTTPLNRRTVPCLFPRCILQTGAGREAYSGLNGPQSVFIIFYRFSHFYSTADDPSQAQRDQKIYVRSNAWLSIVFVFFFSQ